LDKFDIVISTAIKHHNNGKVNEAVHAKALVVWESFFLFKDVVTSG
jgi:hypothetical protein